MSGFFHRNVELIITHSTLFMSQAPFGVFVVLARGSVDHISPTVLVVLRFGGGLIALHGFHFVTRRRNMIREFFELPKRIKGQLLLSAVCASLSPLAFVYGLRQTTAVVAAAIDASCPAVAIMIALVLRTEPLRWSHGLCLLLSMLGNAFVLELWDSSPHPAHVKEKTAGAHLRALIGALLVLTSVLISVGNYSIQKPLLKTLAPSEVITYIGTIAFVFVTSWSLTDVGAFSVLVQPQPVITWCMIAYAVTLQGWSHTLFSAMALKRSSPVMLSMYTTLVPGISSTLAYLLLGEEVGLHQIVGIALVVISVIVSAFSSAAHHHSEGKKADGENHHQQHTRLNPPSLESAYES